MGHAEEEEEQREDAEEVVLRVLSRFLRVFRVMFFRIWYHFEAGAARSSPGAGNPRAD
jgi:hypothetical protein